jgi:hypothetical protein
MSTCSLGTVTLDVQAASSPAVNSAAIVRISILPFV